jgi:hypothetical protein
MQTLFPADLLATPRALRGEESEMTLFVRNEKKPEGVFLLTKGKPLKDVNGTIVGALTTCRQIEKPIS